MNHCEVKGEELKAFFHAAPRLFTRAIFSFFLQERKDFVGGKRSSGEFTRELIAKKRKYKTGSWSKYVARSFGGHIYGEESVDNMMSRMTIRPGREKKLPYLRMLGSGGTIRGVDGGMLLIPFYKNLPSTIVGRLGGGNSKRTYVKWLQENKASTEIIYKNNRMFVFGFFDYKVGRKFREGVRGIDRKYSRLHRKLLFVGVRSVRINKQYDFERSWNKRLTGFQARGNSHLQMFIDKSLASLDFAKNAGWDYNVR